ncbi:hypothetical protein MPTK1_3g19310 [Marchantia polymorpha subsp. ruderalis]|uniref:Uncharacterized protein n=2 Tax=Marchantia polymorpha TaxID=3197 RepID=A0A176WHE5_MARPO|nr:hypothetical protein AXG93_2153s1010 [Marchantia polymorpha subsp. ruderalis]PTQ38825.1 hypothetical protein MARPO_0049s0103 [Marchantia polymorpha]BBN06218.1 hypothetical protein Mp_3g19310 [Marchantia polymorpha subsp. ruderalis]|eukprot:PTQ38825.1 hypothetical protein MARPO_0049s0103 [Marchantia polymorpha]
MTQKNAQFKGQQKKSTAANRHGKQPHIRKGKQFKAPTKKGADWEVNKEVTKFIDAANELKAATQASKEGARLRLVKAPEFDATAVPPKNVKKKKEALIKKS